MFRQDCAKSVRLQNRAVRKLTDRSEILSQQVVLHAGGAEEKASGNFFFSSFLWRLSLYNFQLVAEIWAKTRSFRRLVWKKNERKGRKKSFIQRKESVVTHAVAVCILLCSNVQMLENRTHTIWNCAKSCSTQYGFVSQLDITKSDWYWRAVHLSFFKATNTK